MGGITRYDLVQRTADGLRVYYGVTEDGIHGEWRRVVGGEPALASSTEAPARPAEAPPVDVGPESLAAVTEVSHLEIPAIAAALPMMETPAVAEALAPSEAEALEKPTKPRPRKSRTKPKEVKKAEAGPKPRKSKTSRARSSKAEA
jgi:hypothetical protein